MPAKNLDIDINTIEKAVDILKAISHPIRMSIIQILGTYKKLSVTELHNKLEIDQTTASHHLRILKDKGLLLSNREGKSIFYSLKIPEIRGVLECIKSCQGKFR